MARRADKAKYLDANLIRIDEMKCEGRTLKTTEQKVKSEY